MIESLPDRVFTGIIIRNKVSQSAQLTLDISGCYLKTIYCTLEDTLSERVSVGAHMDLVCTVGTKYEFSKNCARLEPDVTVHQLSVVSLPRSISRRLASKLCKLNLN